MEIFHRKTAGANINSITQANYALFDLFKIKVNERLLQPKLRTIGMRNYFFKIYHNIYIRIINHCSLLSK